MFTSGIMHESVLSNSSYKTVAHKVIKLSLCIFSKSFKL